MWIRNRLEQLYDRASQRNDFGAGWSGQEHRNRKGAMPSSRQAYAVSRCQVQLKLINSTLLPTSRGCYQVRNQGLPVQATQARCFRMSSHISSGQGMELTTRLLRPCLSRPRPPSRLSATWSEIQKNRMTMYEDDLGPETGSDR